MKSNYYANTEFDRYRVWNMNCLCCGSKLTFYEKENKK